MWLEGGAEAYPPMMGTLSSPTPPGDCPSPCLHDPYARRYPPPSDLPSLLSHASFTCSLRPSHTPSVPFQHPFHTPPTPLQVTVPHPASIIPMPAATHNDLPSLLSHLSSYALCTPCTPLPHPSNIPSIPLQHPSNTPYCTPLSTCDPLGTFLSISFDCPPVKTLSPHLPTPPSGHTPCTVLGFGFLRTK